MDSRPVRFTARSALFMLLLALALLSSVHPPDASATSGGDAYRALAPFALPRSQIDISGPAGSGNFGTLVIVLPNGNFVVTDPNFSEGGMTGIGAVYLYSGATRTIISTLKGGTPFDHVSS